MEHDAFNFSYNLPSRSGRTKKPVKYNFDDSTSDDD